MYMYNPPSGTNSYHYASIHYLHVHETRIIQAYNVNDVVCVFHLSISASCSYGSVGAAEGPGLMGGKVLHGRHH